MAAGPQRVSGDARRYNSYGGFNHRFENQRPMSQQLCRNGPQCRKYQEGTCNFNHDFSSLASNGLNVQKKSLNVESPSFTPNFTPKTVAAQPARLGISPKAAAAATFTPRGSGSVTPAGMSHSKESSGEIFPQQQFQPSQQFSEFVPGQSFLPQQQAPLEQPQALPSAINPYSDPFLSSQALQQSIGGLDGSQQVNPYAQATQSVAAQNFFQDATAFKHPLNYHLYTSVGPRRENMLPYQRASADFFIPDDLREDLHKKSEAALQSFANSTLPQTVEHFHSLVALDTNNVRNTSAFGLPSWIYKAVSSKDGNTYALRRIEGFRLTSEAAIRSCHAWKRVRNASMVTVHDAFTGRWFGDSSLIVVTDYHPLSQTLADKHFAQTRTNRAAPQLVPENDLWGYMVQLASALKAIHEAGLAAQTVSASKVLLTSKNRLRLNGCGILDITRFEQNRPVADLQRADLQNLGNLILNIAARNPTASQNGEKALQMISRTYSERFRLCLAWLLSPPRPPSVDGMSGAQETEQVQALNEYNINTLLNNLADKVVSALDNTLHQEDELTSNLMSELENGRLVRLLTKLNVILERPDPSLISPGNAAKPALLNQPSAAWSETGERYYLKLFRDYVFHQVDQDGRPVLDLGYVITCLNKLDAGIDEKIQLVSRDEQNVFVLSYREVKRGFESAWAEISKASSTGRR
ncbi:PAB-dependent poly(A)-specific ribonuclease subunit pan3 [Hortaea werneckii]|nr:PAB-dependent poly(A)-specific ribonuclease subunit pan3 [Hortaea werneckii]